MFSLDAIRIENLRSLADTGYISLKPITVLVGKNSAGKSTFARFIPLLKQSIQERKRAPVLWFGRLVDFGSFNEALSRNTSEDEIRFSFRLTYKVDANAARRKRVSRRAALNLVGGGHIDVTLALKNSKSGTYPDRIVVNAFNREYQISINKNNNIESIKWPTGERHLHEDIQGWAQADKLFPQILFLKKHSSENYYQEHSIFRTQLDEAVRFFVHGNTTNSTISRIAARVPVGRPADVLAHIRNLHSAPASWTESMSACAVKSRAFERIYDAAFLNQLPQLLDEINLSLEKEISKSSYLEPIRATAQRYYRQQELAVEEIDSKGANIAMFLEGLPEYKKKAFSDWLGDHLGFSVSSIKTDGHISLKLSPRDGGVPTNIADMGFGFSQVLPIVAQLWPSMHERRDFRFGSNDRQFVIIEQPELHLHPDFQAKLADIFAKSISKDENVEGENRQLHIMAETHSSSLINRLGQLVAAGKIKKRDVQVVLFEQGENADTTTVKTTSFDDQGLLIDWPFGFFEPDFES